MGPILVTDYAALTRSYVPATALFFASSAGKHEVVKRLLAAGADLNLYCKKTRIHALLSAAEHGHLEVVRLLLKAPGVLGTLNVCREGGISGSALHLAVIKSYTAIIKELLSTPGIDIDVKDSHGRTPLFTAVTTQFFGEPTALLLSAGANPNLKLFAVVDVLKGQIFTEETPLTGAAKIGNDEAVKLLLAAGADVHQRAGGMTALDVAGAMYGPALGGDKVRAVLLDHIAKLEAAGR